MLLTGCCGARNVCGNLLLRIGDFLGFAGTNFCKQDRLVFLSGNFFLHFSESTQYPALIIFSFLLSTCNINTYFQIINQYFLSTVFLCSEFKLENIYSGVNFFAGIRFAVIFICGNLFLRMAEKTAKIRTHKNFQPYGID